MRIRQTRGRTWTTLKNEDFVTPAFLKEVGKMLVDAIVYEAKKDLVKQGNRPTPRGVEEGLPRSERFFNSFSFQIENNGVSVYSSWPQIEQLIQGRRRYSMSWLTKDAGVNIVPMRDESGTVVLRSTPYSKQDAWIHPGFRKHNFVRRGYERARRQMDALLVKQVERVLKDAPLA